jgi:Tfp pilus assembly protein PilX
LSIKLSFFKGFAIFTFRSLLVLMLLLTLTLSVSAYTIFRINQKIHQESLEKQVEAALGYAQETIEARKRAALSVALILSRSPSIIQAYQADDRQAIFKEVSTYLEGMETLSGFGPIDVQFHTRGLEAWVRSWDQSSYGMPLSSFRKGLVHVKETKTPQVSIELGKRLNIKAISPILHH